MVQSNNIFDLKVDGETRDPDVEKKLHSMGYPDCREIPSWPI